MLDGSVQTGEKEERESMQFPAFVIKPFETMNDACKTHEIGHNPRNDGGKEETVMIEQAQ